MFVDFVPTPAVAISLAACAFLPVVVLALSHGPTRVAAPGRRFAIAITLVWLAWAAAMTAAAPGWVDLATSMLLLATATLVAFTLWTLIAWGFTLSMLLALVGVGRRVSIDEWTLAYTRGKPLDAFARDRLGVLLRLGLAEIRGAEVMMTPVRGRCFARIAIELRRLFGLPR